VLKNFHEDLKAEWILQGNLASDFKDKGYKFVIILDNASFHKKAETLKKIASEMPNLILEFLPKYSPDYNLVELVGHSSKEYIANRLFESLEKLESLLHKLLNERGLIMKWHRKIKNKGNLVNAV
jgi:transposase